MAAAVNRPAPAHSGPEGGNTGSRSNSGVTNLVQPDLASHSIGQDLGSSLQHPVFARPIFYIQAPPPPPFLHYQWPMSFTYNPFSGFPGIGYGMVAPPPPFPPPPPPPPYMEAPAYILPHPHIQPIDYRRLIHPNVLNQGASTHNPNQTRRIHLPHSIPERQTVNSEVQTEPNQRARGGDDVQWLPVSSDSGQGTVSNSPCSPRSSSPKQLTAEVANCDLTGCEGKDSQVNEPHTSSMVNHGFDMRPTNAVELRKGETQERQMNKDVGQGPSLIPACKDSHHNLWARSPESLVPVRSSSEKDDGTHKERRISVPDILMNWGGDATQAEMLNITGNEVPEINHKPEEHKSVYQSFPPVAGESTEGSVRAKNEKVLFKVLRLPFVFFEPFSYSDRDGDPVILCERPSLTQIDELQCSLNSDQMILDGERETGDDKNSESNMTDISLYKFSASSCRTKKRFDESIWSVESLAPFFPTRQWLFENGLLEPEVNGMDTKAVNSTLGENQTVDASKERASPLSEIVSCAEEDEKENMSSGPEAPQSPNQKSIIGNEPERNSSHVSERETLNSPTETSPQKDVDTEINRAAVRGQELTEVSPSKGRLVDFGVQCDELQERKCLCEELSSSSGLNRRPLKYSGLKYANDKAEIFCKNGRRQKKSGQWRNSRSQESSAEQLISQLEAHSGLCKAGKSKGGRTSW